MAVITPGSLAGFYGGTARRTPYQGRQYIPSGEETEAQRLARESNERIAEASRKDRLALGITNAILSGANTILDFGVKAYELGRDPAAVRQQVAEAALLDKGAAELESGIDLSPLEPTAPSDEGALYKEVFGTPRPPSTAPLSPQARVQQEQQREPLSMSRGDLELLVNSMDQIQAQYGLSPDGASPAGRQDLIASTASRLGGNVEEAERLVRSMIGQGSFLKQNWRQMVDSGALVLTEGGPTDFWQKVASSAPQGGWKGPRGVAQAMTGVTEAGGAQAGPGMPGYMGKLAEVRDKVGDTALLAQVVDGVSRDPQAGAQLLEEAKAMAPAFDWESLASAAAQGNRAPIIKAYVKALSMTPDQLRAEAPVVGIERAMELFGEDGQPRISRATSIGALQDAYSALEEAGESEKAAMLLDPSAWGRTSDWRSVIPSRMASRPEDAAQAFISGGKAERGDDPVSKARALYQLALSEGDLRRKEKDAQSRRLKARRPRSKAAYRSSVDFAKKSKDMDILRETEEYQRIVEHDKNNVRAEKLAQKVFTGKTTSDVNSLKTASDKIEKERAEADKGVVRDREEQQQTVVQTQALKRDIRRATKEIKDLAKSYGVSVNLGSGTPGQEGYQPMSFTNLSAGGWLAARSKQIDAMTNVDAAGRIRLKDQADAEQVTAAKRINDELMTMISNLEDMKADLQTYLSAGE